MPTAIEWTEETWNPVTGCDRVSPGCARCYALTLAKRLKAMGQPGYQRDGDPRTSGPGFGVTLHPEKLDQPLRWRRPRVVFVNSMSDLFHEEIPDDYIERVFAIMGESPAHTFQVLTKRPERALAFLRDRRWRQFGHSPQMGGRPCFPIIRGAHREDDIPLPNVWLGVSIENARYTWRADVLREIPAAVRFISAEPLLGSLYLTNRAQNGAVVDSHGSSSKASLDLTGIDWVIVGGESGPGARPMDPEWARELRDACLRDRGCDYPRVHDGSVAPLPPIDDAPAFFFKQWGGPTPKAGGRELDGRTWDEMPAVAVAA